jgi:HlyD family secretion protein
MTEPLEALGIEDPRKKGRLLRRSVAAVVVLALGASCSYAWATRGTEGPSYVTGRVTRGDLVATVTATGSIRPVRTVDIGAEISGRVESVHVDVNDRVTVGQVLIEIDTDPFQATVSQGQASVLEARAAVQLATANLDDARRQLARTEELERRGNVPTQQLEQAQAMLARAEAEFASAGARTRLARAGLTESRTTLDRAVIRSPIDGVVLRRTVQPGQTVAASFQAPIMLELAQDLTHMELHVDVDEADVGRVVNGLSATFVVDAYPDRVFRGEITRVAYAGRLVQNVVSYETVISVGNPDLALRPAMTANATIVTETRHGVLLVPSAALRFAPRTNFRVGRDRRWDAPRGPTVWLRRGNTPVPISVEVLGSDETRTEVRGEGLREGAVVITDVRGESE